MLTIENHGKPTERGILYATLWGLSFSPPEPRHLLITWGLGSYFAYSNHITERQLYGWRGGNLRQIFNTQWYLHARPFYYYLVEEECAKEQMKWVKRLVWRRVLELRAVDRIIWLRANHRGDKDMIEQSQKFLEESWNLQCLAWADLDPEYRTIYGAEMER